MEYYKRERIDVDSLATTIDDNFKTYHFMFNSQYDKTLLLCDNNICKHFDIVEDFVDCEELFDR